MMLPPTQIMAAVPIAPRNVRKPGIPRTSARPNIRLMTPAIELPSLFARATPMSSAFTTSVLNGWRDQFWTRRHRNDLLRLPRSSGVRPNNSTRDQIKALLRGVEGLGRPKLIDAHCAYGPEKLSSVTQKGFCNTIGTF